MVVPPTPSPLPPPMPSGDSVEDRAVWMRRREQSSSVKSAKADGSMARNVFIAEGSVARFAGMDFGLLDIPLGGGGGGIGREGA